MHIEFQKIITNFLQAPLPKLGSVDFAKVDGLNIEKSLCAYESQNLLYYQLVHYLDNERILLEKNLATGQTTDPGELAIINDRINELDTNSGLLIDRINYLGKDSARLLKERDFLLLRAPFFAEYDQFSSSYEYHLYFLNDDFTNDYSECAKYRRLLLDRENYNKLTHVFMSSLSPQLFIENTRKLLGLSAENTIALSYFEPRQCGFMLYVDPNDQTSSQLISDLANKDPANITLQGNNTWLINTLTNDALGKELLSHFNVWIDCAWLTLYLQENLFPITKISNPIQKIAISPSAYLGSLFELNSSKAVIDVHAIQSAINKYNPFWFIKDICVFEGGKFNPISPITPLTNVILIKFFEGESCAHLAYYSISKNEIILCSPAHAFESQLIEQMFQLNNALIQYAPLVSSTSDD